MQNIKIGEIKREALTLLKGNWVTGVGINLIFLLIALGIELFNNLEENILARVEYNIFLLIIFTIIFVILNITFTTINTMGNFACFLDLAKGKPLTVNNYSYGFKYMETAFRIGGAFSLFSFLWSLLLVIPGIIKSVSYSMAFFIGIEYPDISGRDALKLSSKLTDGHKWTIFWFSLHFLGWIILAFVTIGIGWLWLGSYLDTSFSLLYLKLKREKYELFKDIDEEYYLKYSTNEENDEDYFDEEEDYDL